MPQIAVTHLQPIRVELTGVERSLAWMRIDLPVRLVPFGLAAAFAALAWRPAWLGLAPGRLEVQLPFGLAGAVVMFVGAAALQLWLSPRRGALLVPSGPRDALLQGAYYCVNGPLEEVFFRGLLQGGLSALVGHPAGFAAATVAYVLYHRLGGWSWIDVAATVLAGVPLGLAFWLLPGPPSLLGVSLVHIGATCGFLGPGPFLLRRLRLLP